MNMNTSDLIKFVIATLEEMKAQEITTLDVRELTDITDAMIICTATSNRHAKSIANFLETESKTKAMPPIGVEGEEFAEWILVDLGDVIVHIMQASAREFYSLERLWAPHPSQD